MRENAIFLFPV